MTPLTTPSHGFRSRLALTAARLAVLFSLVASLTAVGAEPSKNIPSGTARTDRSFNRRRIFGEATN